MTIWKLSLCLFLVISLALPAQGQHLRDRKSRSTHFSPLTLAMPGSPAVRVAATPTNRCSPTLRLRISTDRSGFFANSQRDLLTEWPQITAHLGQRCPETTEVSIEGTSRGRAIYKGTASASDGWQLSHIETPLQAALNDADKQAARFEDTRQLDTVIQRHSAIFGGTGTPDAIALEARIEQRKAKLLDERYKQYLHDLRSVPETMAGLDRIEAVSGALFPVLERRYPAAVSRFRDAQEERAKAVQMAIVAQTKRDLERPMSGWREAVDRIALILERQVSFGTRVPGIRDAAREALEKVNRELDRYLPEFRDFLITTGEDWDALERLEEEKRKLNRAADTASSATVYAQAIDERRASVIAQLEQREIREIETVGASLADIEFVVDRGQDAAQRFSNLDYRISRRGSVRLSLRD